MVANIIRGLGIALIVAFVCFQVKAGLDSYDIYDDIDRDLPPEKRYWALIFNFNLGARLDYWNLVRKHKLWKPIRNTQIIGGLLGLFGLFLAAVVAAWF